MRLLEASPETISDVVLGPKSLSGDLFLIVVGSAYLALCSQLTIPVPFSPVPMTGQTFAVLTLAGILGARRATAAVMLYLVEGASGLPVFSGFRGGASVLLGPTGGYLMGFPLCTMVIGWLTERGWDRRFGTALASMFLGTVAIYAMGLPLLALWVGPERVLQQGLYPFLLGDVVKVLLAAIALPGTWRGLTLWGDGDPGSSTGA